MMPVKDLFFVRYVLIDKYDGKHPGNYAARADSEFKATAEARAYLEKKTKTDGYKGYDITDIEKK